MTETTWIDRKLDDHLLVRDLLLVTFLVVGYGGSMAVVLEMRWWWGLGMGICFAVLFLAATEIHSRRNDTSMFRYFFGGDPLEE